MQGRTTKPSNHALIPILTLSPSFQSIIATWKGVLKKMKISLSKHANGKYPNALPIDYATWIS
jgi:hypothetical protein